MKKTILIMLMSVMVWHCAAVPVVHDSPNMPTGQIDGTQLSQYIDEYVEYHRDTTAAMSVAVFTSADVLFEQSYGYANIGQGMMNSEDTVMDWGSVTKLLVWVSIMQLAEQGRLDSCLLGFFTSCSMTIRSRSRTS